MRVAGLVHAGPRPLAPAGPPWIPPPFGVVLSRVGIFITPLGLGYYRPGRVRIGQKAHRLERAVLLVSHELTF